MLRNIYGFTDSGKKVKVGTYDDGLYPVGGRIFYIDPNSDETVEFYDVNGSELSNIDVGSTPAYYKVTSAGVSGKDKYYVYKDEFYSADRLWTYYDNGSWVYESLGTSKDIGTGKTNTSSIMTIHDGAYISENTDAPSKYPTVWYQVQQWNLNKLDNCSDWYIGSHNELDALRLFIDDNILTLGLTDLFSDHYIWSSSETFSTNTTIADGWFSLSWSSTNKNSTMIGLLAIRSF